jgi:hypothetical protein
LIVGDIPRPYRLTIRQYLFSTGHALTHYSTATVINVAAGFAISCTDGSSLFLSARTAPDNNLSNYFEKKKKKKN